MGSTRGIRAARSCNPSDHGGEHEVHRATLAAGASDKKSVGGDGSNHIVDGVAMGLGRLVPARAELGVELD
jgi:hypothetical protein